MADWELRTIHPLYGVAWLGLGLALSLVAEATQRGIRAWTLRCSGLGAFSLAAVAALPVAMWKLDSKGFLAPEFAFLRLAKTSGGDVSASLLAWTIHDGITAKICATVLPALLVLPPGWLLYGGRRRLGVVRPSPSPWVRCWLQSGKPLGASVNGALPTLCCSGCWLRPATIARSRKESSPSGFARSFLRTATATVHTRPKPRSRS